MKILIVEDEAIQRRALEQMILEILPAAQVRGVADGRDAVAAARATGPDVIFLDIRMPGLDGLTAARQLRPLVPDAVLYFLTAYDQFDYAQQAVGLGATGFLLKPLSPDDLAGCLSYASLRHRQLAEERARQAELLAMLGDALPLLRSQFVRDLCLGTLTSPALYRRRAALFGVAQSPEVALSLGFGGEPGESDAVGPEEDATPVVPAGAAFAAQIREAELELTRRDLARAVEELVAGQIPGALVARIAHDELAVLAPAGATRAGPRGPLVALRRLGAAILALCRESGLVCAAGIGNPVPGPLLLWRSYREAVQARTRAWLLADPGCLLLAAADFPSDGGEWHRYPLLAERGLAESVRGGFEDQTRSYLRQLVPFFGEAAAPPGPGVRSRAVECLALLARAASEGGAAAEEVLDLSTRAQGRVLQATAGGEIGETVSAAARSLAELVSRHQDRRQSGLAARAAAYLEGHFPGAVSLTALASELHVSPFYLSHVFRQSMGQTFSEYLTGIRIREAKRLLTATDLPVGEIAARVGYREANYFGRVFKKATGQTPLAWRRGGGRG